MIVSKVSHLRHETHHGCWLEELETRVKAEEQALKAEPEHQTTGKNASPSPAGGRLKSLTQIRCSRVVS